MTTFFHSSYPPLSTVRSRCRSYCWRFHCTDHRSKVGVYCHRQFVPSFLLSTWHSAFIIYFWYSVACGVASALGIPLLRETYAPVIRQRLAAKSGDPEKIAAAQPDLMENGKLHHIWINLSRPMVLLFRSSICFMLSLYMALWVIK